MKGAITNCRSMIPPPEPSVTHCKVECAPDRPSPCRTVACQNKLSQGSHGRGPFSRILAILCATAIVTTSQAAAYAQQQASNSPPEQFSSVEERRLYDAIQKERASIRDERQELELKKKELKSIEEGVDKKLAEVEQKLTDMKALSQKIEQLLAAKSEAELKKTQDLAKIYEKMSPDKAALAISGLDKQLAADLLANMKVKSAAKILDQISKQTATDLSTTFSTIQLE